MQKSGYLGAAHASRAPQASDLPGRCAQHGSREHSIDEEAAGLAQPSGAPVRARMAHSPHAAAASRRFLTPAGAGAGGFYGAGTPRGSHFSVSAAAGAAATAAAAAAAAPAEPQPRYGGAGARVSGDDPAEQRAGERQGPTGRGGGAGYPPYDSSPGAGPPPASARRSARGEDGAGARGSGTAVKMGRREAWARFLAYEARRTPQWQGHMRH